MSAARSRQWPGRPQTWVFVIACLFVCDFILCGYVPAQKRLRSLEQARARQLQTIQLAAAQSAELRGLRHRLRDTRQTADRYDTCVPPERAVGTFLQQIAAIMTKHHLTDHMVVPAEELPGDAQNCIPMQVTCKGSLGDIYGFFRDLQSLERLVRIEKVTLQNNNELTGLVTLQMNAAIFYQHRGQRNGIDSTGANLRGGAGDDA
jgi:Tfp pilus assembly protein PilO